MTEVVPTFNLDRKVNVDNNVDAFGIQWVIQKQRGRSLLVVRPNPDREDAVIPKSLAGEWTQEHALTEQIKLYIEKTWDDAADADLKAEGKRRTALAFKEEKKEETIVDKVEEKSFIDTFFPKED